MTNRTLYLANHLMKTIIIYVNFKTRQIIIKLITNVSSTVHFKPFMCQDTILETIDLSHVNLMNETTTSLHQLYTLAMHGTPAQITQPLLSVCTIDVKHVINKWITNININTRQCVIDLTDVSHYEFKQYRNFIQNNFANFVMLHS